MDTPKAALMEHRSDDSKVALTEPYWVHSREVDWAAQTADCWVTQMAALMVPCWAAEMADCLAYMMADLSAHMMAQTEVVYLVARMAVRSDNPTAASTVGCWGYTTADS